METAETIAGVRSRIADWRRTGNRVGFVPTMGNLHAGHLSLISLAQAKANRVVVSIFVNPLQFGPDEDFARYPRTIEEDLRKLVEADTDLLFLPAAAEVYPTEPEASTFVEVPGLSDQLCGRFRPGHFRGVTTVVCKLLNIVQPDFMVLGEKDYQQLILIGRMVRDLNLPVEIVPGPTVREPDGLALSSRNGYLTVEERRHAARLQRSLARLADALQNSEFTVAEGERHAADDLRRAGFRVDYVSVRRRSDLAVPAADDRQLIVLAATWLGHTRLIDNFLFERRSR